MSNILKEYAHQLGVGTAGLPIIQDHYFPLSEGKYITVYAETQIPAKAYRFFDAALSFLKSVLDIHGYKVFQIGESNGQLINIDGHYGALNTKQLAYILKHSSLHIGVDNLYTHIANSFNVPTITLYGNVYSSVTTPLWNDRKVDIEAPWKVKPALSIVDPNDSINQIDFAKIIENCYSILGIEKQAPKTVYCGKSFGQSITEIIPVEYINLPEFQNKILNIRLDYEANQNAFIQFCQNHPVALLLKNKIIPLEHLEPLRNNIKRIAIMISDMNFIIPEKYFEILAKWKIDVILLVDNPDILTQARLTYFDQNVVPFYTNERPSQIASLKGLAFESSKTVFYGRTKYPSIAHYLQKKSVDNFSKIIDTPEYWQDLEHFYIYE